MGQCDQSKKEELKAADAAMFATANPSIGGFDVRGFRLCRRATARQVMFDVKTSKTKTGRRNEMVHRGVIS